jgi:O-antigen ligase
MGGNITSTTTATADALVDEARLGGGAGNPNLLATGLVPAAVVVAGLAATVESVRWRIVAAVTALVLAGGLAATQSRGGILAALATVVAALIFFRRRRLYVLGAALMVAGAAVGWLSANPDAWKRISSFNNGGSGRSDLWTVAWRVFEDHPVAGAGLNNFEVVAGDYIRRPGVLQRGDLIVDHPHVVHNTYLQLLAENGVIGCALFLAVVVGCLWAAWKAGMLFEARAEAGWEALSRAVLVGGIAILVAGFFGSYGVDRRLWILFALGPALLNVSSWPRPSPIHALHSGIRR